MINAEQLNAIKERAAKATPGPWRSAGLYGVRTQNDEALSIPLRPSDATFIAHAREDVPALVAEVEQLQAEIERVDALYSEKYILTTHYKNQTYEQALEIERLRKALKFYAKPGNYEPWRESDEDRTDAFNFVDLDGGDIAREALK